MDPASVPDFDDLPKVQGQPQGCAWGIFDKDGKKDHYGTLNFLTPEIVAAAAKEVKDGVSVSLNWPLNGIKFPFPFRKAPVHKVLPLSPEAGTGHGFDDEIEINTQFSSQWDSLCHFTGAEGITYNGHRPTKEGLEAAAFTHENPCPTIDHWHSRGGLVGRGVLIDYKRYAEEVLGQGYHPAEGYRITVEDVEKVAEWEGVEFRRGDVVLIRTGYTEMLESPTPADFAKFAETKLSGLHGTVETARWVWNKRFAAMASDSHAFEAFPPLNEETGEVTTVEGLILHKWFLNYFGLPIGELWDLKALGEYAKRTGRYSFLLTSSPLNHPGLVASPPNAIAIF